MEKSKASNLEGRDESIERSGRVWLEERCALAVTSDGRGRVQVEPESHRGQEQGDNQEDKVTITF